MTDDSLSGHSAEDFEPQDSSQAPERGSDEENIPPFIASPDKVDGWMWAYLVIATLFSFAMMPLRVWLLNHPVAYALMVGGYTSSIVGGAESNSGGTSAVVIVLLTLIGALKTVPLWWLVGAKWGQEYLRMSIAHSPRLQRWAVRLQDARPSVLSAVIILSYIPFVPTIVIANLLAGIRRMKFWTVMALNAVGVLLVNALFAYLGVRFGTQVIAVVEQVNKYALWVTIGLIVVMVWTATRQNKARR